MLETLDSFFGVTGECIPQVPMGKTCLPSLSSTDPSFHIISWWRSLAVNNQQHISRTLKWRSDTIAHSFKWQRCFESFTSIRILSRCYRKVTFAPFSLCSSPVFLHLCLSLSYIFVEHMLYVGVDARPKDGRLNL